jgi:signal transduction histidine kinase
MRLLNASIRAYLYYSILIAVIIIPACFFVIKTVLQDQIDATLRANRKQFVTHIGKFQNLEDLEVDLAVMDELSYDLDVLPAKQHSSEQYYETVFVYDSLEESIKPYRELSSVILIKHKPYLLTIRMSLVENEKLGLAVGVVLVCFFVLLVIGLFLINRALSQKILLPFYSTLQKLKAFKLDNNHPFEFENTAIIEFNDLNAALKLLMEKNRQVFLNQKSFIEDASHELQTPLAIFQSKLDMLMQSSELTEQQAAIVNDLIGSNKRMAKLNKSLLLMSLLENDQFVERETIDLRDLLQETLTNFRMLSEGSGIREVTSINSCVISGNRNLLEILMNNLLRNAYEHNIPSGRIEVTLTHTRFTVSNTGEPLSTRPEKLFERFKKDKVNSAGSGLGLAIVKKICDLSGYDITYQYDSGIHNFTVDFAENKNGINT